MIVEELPFQWEAALFDGEIQSVNENNE